MSRRGFTLVEAVVASVIAAMVLGLAVQLLSRATGASSRMHAQLDARERACQALLELRLALADATAVTAPQGLALSFTGPLGAGEVRLDPAAGRLEARWPGRPGFTPLIASGVLSFHVTPIGAGALNLILELARKGDPLIVCDEVLVPAIAQRAGGEPWNHLE